MPNAEAPYGKNIVLFSDGTGNSASKPFKTNVWRTYQALDLEPPREPEPGETAKRLQIAFYRDGVGTETFKPLALLGGAFGFGVMRDIRLLYTYLCRNYKDGDRIYAFGFSRGAFTIRLLVGLVAKCGLVQATDENQLFHRVTSAYKAFRRDALIRAASRRGMIYNYILAPPCYVENSGEHEIELHLDVKRPVIDFLGLWDTVDAYGMPVDELKQAIDQWIWPMSLADRRLSPIVKRACHALSLDDERPTFRPLLWDQRQDVDKARIEQVWFAGVHANVGGGYPIDDLSYVPLCWMLQRANDAGLRLDEAQAGYYQQNQNVHGTAYDSRSGVAGYYRYGPRSLEKLCDDKRNKVLVSPVIHESVCERIAKRHRPYAPLSLPGSLPLPKPGSTQMVVQDQAFVDLAWDTVFWRRITYFSTVLLTLFVVIAPLFVPSSPAAPKAPSGWVERLWDWVRSLAPSWSKTWVDALVAYPIVALPTLGLLAWLFFGQSGRLQRWIGERSEWAWAAMKDNDAVPAPTPTRGDRFIQKLRFSPTANSLAAGYEKHMPCVLGFLLFVAVVITLCAVPVLIAVRLRGLWLTFAILAALGLACFRFLQNARYRNEIDTRLRSVPGGPTKVPEREWSYGPQDLERFKSKAAGIRYADGRSILEIYHSPVLLPNDFIFALSLGCFVALVGLQMRPHGWLWSVSAIFGLLYMACDVLEDMALAKVFGSAHLPPLTARAAPWMTRGKMVFLALSMTGLVVFLALRAVGRRLTPAVPSRF